MSWITAGELGSYYNLYDADGILIDRKVTGFNPETGEVVMAQNREEILKRRETFKGPLTWRKIEGAGS